MAGPGDLINLFMPPGGINIPGGSSVLIVMLLGGIAIIGYMFFRKNPLKKFTVTVKVNEHLKNGKLYTYFTAGRLTGRFGEFREYQLKNGDRTRVPSYSDLSPMGGGKFFLELDKFEDGRYGPHRDEYKEAKNEKGKDVEVIEGKPGILGIGGTPDQKTEKEKEYAVALYNTDMNHDDINWLTQTIFQNIAKFSEGSFLAKYGKDIAMVLIIFAGVIFIYASVQYGLIPITKEVEAIAGTNVVFAQTWANTTDKWIQYENDRSVVLLEILKQIKEIRGGNLTVIP